MKKKSTNGLPAEVQKLLIEAGELVYDGHLIKAEDYAPEKAEQTEKDGE